MTHAENAMGGVDEVGPTFSLSQLQRERVSLVAWHQELNELIADMDRFALRAHWLRRQINTRITELEQYR